MEIIFISSDDKFYDPSIISQLKIDPKYYEKILAYKQINEDEIKIFGFLSFNTSGFEMDKGYISEFYYTDYELEYKMIRRLTNYVKAMKFISMKYSFAHDNTLIKAFRESGYKYDGFFMKDSKQFFSFKYEFERKHFRKRKMER